ncbi:hypothetical protein EH220_04150 [bacterium]|nr:MAG: hypothetical protein EH220_04150 [bacterium]
MRKIHYSLFFILLALSILSDKAFCGKPWLMSFPEIAYDDNRICFSNDKWVAYYHLESKLIYTLPRDSISLPPRKIPTNTVVFDSEYFFYRGSAIERIRFPELPIVYTLPELTETAAKPFLEKWSNPPKSLANVRETIGTMAFNRGVLWFGLTAEDRNGQTCGGLGWFNPKREQFGRIYSPSLVSNAPQWIEVVRDTVVVLYESQPDLTKHLIFYSLKSGKLSDLDYRQAGIPGDEILGIDKWQSFILLATDEAVAIWAPGYQPNVWTTKAYASRTPIRLKMLNFINGKPDYDSMEDFLPMMPNRPCEVMAQVGNLVELVAQAGIEGYVPQREWKQYGKRWQGFDWGCGNNLCFARVRVPTQDRYIEGDLLNTPLTFIGTEQDMVKIGFTAGWARIDELTPALLPYP